MNCKKGMNFYKSWPLLNQFIDRGLRKLRIVAVMWSSNYIIGVHLNLVQACTIPLDTAKVRLQLQKKAVGDAAALPKYRGLLGTVGTIAREEGLVSLWKGVIPGLHRQCLYGGLRIGLYDPVGIESSSHIKVLCILCVFCFLLVWSQINF